MKILRKALSLGVAGAFFFLSTAPLLAADREITYPQQNPSSSQVNQQPRNERLTQGNFLRDMLGSSGLNGFYVNMSIVTAGGMNVVVQPTTAGQQGTLYQLLADDPNPLPIGFSPQIPADPTVTMIPGALPGSSNVLGPMAAPGSAGQSVYYLVEAQLQTLDGTPESQTFLDVAGRKYFQTLNTVRSDVVSFLLKAGVAGSSPTAPTPDTGWIGVGTVLIPFGTSTINGSMISQAAYPPFGGFLTVGSAVTSVGATAPVTSTGGATPNVACPTCVTNVTGSGNIASSGGTTPNVTFTGVLPIASGGTATAAPTGVSAGSGISVSGSFPAQTVAISAPVSLANGGTNATSLASGCLGSSGTAVASGTNCVQTVGAGTGISVGGTAANPTVGLSTPVSIANGGTNAVSLTSSDCLRYNGTAVVSAAADCLTSVTAGNSSITVGGTATAPTVAIAAPVSVANGGTGATSTISGDCVRASSSTTYASAAGDCVTNVTGTSPIASSGGTTPAISCATCAIVGTNKTTFAVERFMSGAITASSTAAMPLPSGATAFTATADNFQCTTAGSGTSTFKWQYTTAADPVVGSPTWTDVTGSSLSWTTAGGASPSTFTAVNLTGVSALWMRATVTAVGGTAPQNCYFYLHGTQTVQ